MLKQKVQKLCGLHEEKGQEPIYVNSCTDIKNICRRKTKVKQMWSGRLTKKYHKLCP